MSSIVFNPIGIIRTPFKDLGGMPIQPGGARAAEGEIIIDSAYEKGLKDIDEFSHLILIYQFHKSQGFSLIVTPFLDSTERGVFATRAPRRPNAVGISVVSLLSRKENRLRVENIDVVDQTPLLDIKPYVPNFDSPEVTAIGWLEGKAEEYRAQRSDQRFDV